MNNLIGILFTDQKSFNELELHFDFDLLKPSYELKYIFGKTIIDASKYHTQLKFDSLSVRVHAFLHNLLLWKYRNSTLSFKLRAYAIVGTKKQHTNWTSVFNYDKQRLSFVKRIIVRTFGRSFGVFATSVVLEVIFRLKKVMLRNQFSKFDSILLSYGGRPSIQQDFLIWLGKQKQFATIAFQENWDNLTSKTVLFQHPDIFATWGIQSSNHLKWVQKYNGIIMEIGNLKIEKFYKARYKTKSLQKNILDKKSNTKDILIIGTSWGVYDLKLLNTCIKVLDSEKINSRFRIIYRPHPYGRLKDKIFNEINSFDKLVVDDPVKGESTDYRISQILNSTFVVSLYSTTILEASIVNKICIIPSFLDVDSNYPIQNFAFESDYFKDISVLEGIYNPTSIEEFLSILEYYDKFENYKISNNLKILEYICAQTNTSDQILSVINMASLLSKKSIS